MPASKPPSQFRARSFEGLGLPNALAILRNRSVKDGWRERSVRTYSRIPKQYQPVVGMVYTFLRRKRPGILLGIDEKALAELTNPFVLGNVNEVPVTIELARKNAHGDSREARGVNNYGTFKIGYGKACCFLKISKNAIAENLQRGLIATNTALTKAGHVVNNTHVEAVDHILIHDFSFRKGATKNPRTFIVTDFFPENEYEQVWAMQPCPAKDHALQTLHQVKKLVDKETGPWPTPDISGYNAFRSKKDGSLHLFDLSP